MGDHSIYTTRVYSPISKIQILIVISFEQMCNKAFGTNIWQNLYVCLYNLDAFQNIFVCVNWRVHYQQGLPRQFFMEVENLLN